MLFRSIGVIWEVAMSVVGFIQVSEFHRSHAEFTEGNNASINTMIYFSLGQCLRVCCATRGFHTSWISIYVAERNPSFQLPNVPNVQIPLMENRIYPLY